MNDAELGETMKLAFGNPVWLELSVQPAAFWRSFHAPESKPKAAGRGPAKPGPPPGAPRRHRTRVFLEMP